MSGQNQYKKKKAPASAPAPASKFSEKAVKGQLAWAAGTEYFQHRDPVYHVEESFCNTFDMLGSQRARGGQGVSPMRDEVSGLTDPAGRKFEEHDGEGKDSAGSGEATSAFMGQTSMDSMYKPRNPDSQDRLMNRFSDMAFQRGNLAGAVLRGQGSMMLFSCLKRTVGQSQPKNLRERKLFQQSSVHSLVKGSNKDMVIYNRGFSDSAIGLVTNVLRDSRGIVDSMTKLATGGGGTGGDGAGTLQKMYPFLSADKEESLLQQYRARLSELDKGSGSADEKRVLQSAIVKTEALINKKAQMKAEFISKLRSVSYSASAAIAVFEQEEFRAAVRARLSEELPDEPPPPDDGGDGKPDGTPDKGGEDAGDNKK